MIEKMPGFDFLGFIPHLTDIMDADLEGRPPYETATSVLEIVKKMLGSLED